MGAESLGAGNALHDAISALGTPAKAQAAYDAISGEIHASTKTALIEDSRFVREAALGRISDAFDDVGAHASDQTGLWMQGFGAYGQTESDGNAAALSHATGGLFLGPDSAVIGNWQFGVLAGVSRTGFNAVGRASSGSATNYDLGAYGGTKWGDLAFCFGGAYSWHVLDITRTVPSPASATRSSCPTMPAPVRCSANSATVWTPTLSWFPERRSPRTL